MVAGETLHAELSGAGGADAQVGVKVEGVDGAVGAEALIGL